MKYFQLIKPKIILGNLFSVTGGFFLASNTDTNYKLLIYTLIGMFFIISSSCMFNNYIDQDIDKHMKRTRERVIFTKSSSIKNIIFCIIFIIIGLNFLIFFVNFLITCIAFLAYLNYIIIYSLYMKRKSIYSTIVGSFSGSCPPIIGYCAITNRIDIIAFILLLMFIFWQISHFYTISIYHFEDYKLVNLPILPIKKGVLITQHHIVLSIIGFTMLTLILTIKKHIGYEFFIITSLTNLFWICLAIKGYYLSNIKTWSYYMFIFSIIAITITNIMILVDFIIKNKMLLNLI